MTVIVIGCGAMGLSALHQLASRGHRAIGVEQFSVPHAMGSSHGHTRMTRTAYYEHPDYVPLLLRAHALWRELEGETGTAMLEMVGGLYMGAESSELIAGSLRAARGYGLAHELLSAGELKARFPQFSPGEGAIALLERQAGYLLVDRAVSALAHAALSKGAVIHPRTKVVDVRTRAGHVEVVTEVGVIEGDHAIITTGAWAGRFGSVPRVTATRQTLAWFWPEEARRFRDIPAWAFDTGGGSLFYGFPMLAERPGLKVAHHAPASPTDPDEVDRGLHARDEEALRLLLSKYIPLAAEGPLLSMTTCLYENSSDGHFNMGRVSERVTTATGFSGHGFKFTPVVGEVLADLATTGETRHPIGFLSPHRH